MNQRPSNPIYNQKFSSISQHPANATCLQSHPLLPDPSAGGYSPPPSRRQRAKSLGVFVTAPHTSSQPNNTRSLLAVANQPRAKAKTFSLSTPARFRVNALLLRAPFISSISQR